MHVLYLAYRPDDRELTFRGEGDSTVGLYAVDAGGQGLRTIVPSGVADFGILSPDGTKLVYQTSNTGTLDAALHVVDAVTGRDLTPTFDPPSGDGVIDDGPSWSPDGTTILFRRYHGSPAYRLAVMTLSTGTVVEIGPSRSVGWTDYGQFSPDGTQVLAYYGSGPSTWVLDPTGVAADRRLPTEMVDRAAWQRLAP